MKESKLKTQNGSQNTKPCANENYKANKTHYALEFQITKKFTKLGIISQTLNIWNPIHIEIGFKGIYFSLPMVTNI